MRTSIGRSLAAVAILSAASPALAQEASWSGPYVGATIGGNLPHGGDARTVGTPAFLTLVPSLAPATLDTSRNSIAAGAHIGYNLESGGLVYGVEADLSYLGAKKTSSFTSTATVLGTTLSTTAAHQIDYLGTVRARLGYAPNAKALVYATGGLAYGRVKDTATVIGNAAPSSLVWNGVSSGTRTGFTLGGGAEFKVGDRVSLRGEYLYYDLGSQTTTAAGSAGVRGIAALNGIDYSQRTSAKGSIVRVGLNFAL
ncbi:outer membrane protein [Novosphingobium piscinae]|uniref:Porin family protein n=1 Tax=Novosphingobium piscinae TaxID=1507448 RepID=A0A7X1FV99_9SPHN|nr:outer membrane beta-barrel protein [Novosphingobium piscinae]MBC2667626.1 porin family protein [Novosphingobium piscinae]